MIPDNFQAKMESRVTPFLVCKKTGPPMPRMAPMNFKVEAKRKKEAYPAVMNLIMAGPWVG